MRGVLVLKRNIKTGAYDEWHIKSMKFSQAERGRGLSGPPRRIFDERAPSIPQGTCRFPLPDPHVSPGEGGLFQSNSFNSLPDVEEIVLAIVIDGDRMVLVLI